MFSKFETSDDYSLLHKDPNKIVFHKNTISLID